MLFLRRFGMLLTLVFGLILLVSFTDSDSGGMIIVDSGNYLLLPGNPELQKLREVNWPVALPIGLGLSSGITCVIVATWRQQRRVAGPESSKGVAR